MLLHFRHNEEKHLFMTLIDTFLIETCYCLQNIESCRSSIAAVSPLELPEQPADDWAFCPRVYVECSEMDSATPVAVFGPVLID